MSRRTDTDAHAVRRSLSRAALLSLTIGSATIGCTPSMRLDHVATVSADARRGDAAAGKAQTALDRHDFAGAVRWAEIAVAARPADADCRLLLGHAYLGAGRFTSAQTSFQDTLTLAPDRARARFDLALTQIVQGAPADARVTLASLKGRVSDTDLGLALALAGDRSAGIAMLTAVIRAGQSDARTRQNLALAFALDDQWAQARGMAMQDTPPDRLEAKLAGWAAMARQGPGAQQVAAMLGTLPDAADPGLPTRLALAAPALPAAPPSVVSAPVALALATPAPLTPPTPTPAPAPTSAIVSPAVPPASAAAVPVLLAQQPVLRLPELIRIAQAVPAPARAASVAPGPLLKAPSDSGYVVQLGAYTHSDALVHAWARASRLSPRVAAFTPVTANVSRDGATLVRLSIGGFDTRASAVAVCEQVRARGGACFVRAATGDRRWQWAREEPPRPAAPAARA